MEKEIYITEAPLYPDGNQNFIPREKSAPTLFASRVGIRQISTKSLPPLPHESYYESKILKPGPHLFKSIIELQQKRANGEHSGPHLKLNISETVVLNDNSNCLISTENGIVQVDPFVTNQSFISKLGFDPSHKILYPAIIQSSISGNDLNNSIMMSNEIFANKIIPRSQGFLCRRFVPPYASTPNILRLYFAAPSCKRQKRNYGYKLLNKSPMTWQIFTKKHRQTHSYIVNPEKKSTYSMTILKGKCLLPFQQMAHSLIQYLQNGFPVKITELVLDFVIDNNKVPWLLEVKAVKSTTLTKLWDIGNDEEIELLVEKNNNSQICKLCRMMFSKQEVQKLVTNKLIWEITAHIQQRGIPAPQVSHLRKQGFSNVCEVCYSIIVSEHSLIEVEKQFSSILNITPLGADNGGQPVEDGKFKMWKELNCAENGVLKFPKMKAWRLFFYLQKIKYNQSVFYGKPQSINLQVRLKNYKQKFTKEISQQVKSQFNPFLSKFSKRIESAKVSRNKFMDVRNIKQEGHCGKSGVSMTGKSGVSLTTMASKVTTNHIAFKENIDIKKAKVLTFYTREDQNNILEDAEMQFSLFLNEDKFEGRSLTLQQFKSRDTCQRHGSEVFLFDKQLKYCNLELTVGLICDGQKNADDLALKENGGVYYSDKLLTTYLPLPSEWMEVFTKGQYIPSLAKEFNYEEIKHGEMLRKTKIERAR